MKRRTFVLGALAAGAAASWLGRPRDEAAPHDAYFTALAALLRREGITRPSMVIDLDRLDGNIDAMMASIRAGKKHYRVVAKSLPSVELIRYVLRRSGTDRLMAFHQPFLGLEAVEFPKSDILLGKPMPVASADLFYRQHRGAFDPARQLQWLIDTPQRLQQYLELARGRGLRLNLSIEIDVGLHRGGARTAEELEALLAPIAANPDRLRFSGFMGYDPHVAKLPRLAGTREELFAASQAQYRRLADHARERHPQLWHESLTLNGAGSPTYKLHEGSTLTNDLAVGSALVKPTDFDLPTLDAHAPALFIATPVLKVQDGVQIPGLPALGKLQSWWDPNRRRTYFIYGGNWLAKPESPAGLRYNGLYGRSSNQEMLNGGEATALAPDDYVFLRPTQSEAIMLQFGDLLGVRGGRIEARWPVFDASEAAAA